MLIWKKKKCRRLPKRLLTGQVNCKIPGSFYNTKMYFQFLLSILGKYLSNSFRDLSGVMISNYFISFCALKCDWRVNQNSKKLFFPILKKKPIGEEPWSSAGVGNFFGPRATYHIFWVKAGHIICITSPN